MGSLFANGVLIDGILVLMLAEWLILILVRKKLGRGPLPRELLVNLGAGAALLLAVRAALHADSGPMLALWLLVALCCHLSDLRWRWMQRHD